MKYREKIAWALDIATALVATTPDRLPFVLCDLRAKGLTSRMVQAVRPLLATTAPEPIGRYNPLKDSLAELLAYIGPVFDRDTFPGDCAKDRMKAMLGAFLAKPGSYFYASTRTDQDFYHRAATDLGMVIGTKFCRGHQARLVWRVS